MVNVVPLYVSLEVVTVNVEKSVGKKTVEYDMHTVTQKKSIHSCLQHRLLSGVPEKAHVAHVYNSNGFVENPCSCRIKSSDTIHDSMDMPLILHRLSKLLRISVPSQNGKSSCPWIAPFLTLASDWRAPFALSNLPSRKLTDPKTCSMSGTPLQHF